MNVPKNLIYASHVVVDLETYDTAETAVVLAIGLAVVRYDWQGECFREGEVPAVGCSLVNTIGKQRGEGRTAGEPTIQWWRSPDRAAAWRALEDDPVQMKTSNEAREWVTNALGLVGRGDIRLWGNGSGFDCNILRHFMGDGFSQKFWHDRDLRTIVELAPIDRVRPDRPHVALDDARAEAMTLTRALNALYEL